MYGFVAAGIRCNPVLPGRLPTAKETPARSRLWRAGPRHRLCPGKKIHELEGPEEARMTIDPTVCSPVDADYYVWWAGRPKTAPRGVGETVLAIGKTERHPAFSWAFRTQRDRISTLVHPNVGVRGAVLGTEPA